MIDRPARALTISMVAILGLMMLVQPLTGLLGLLTTNNARAAATTTTLTVGMMQGVDSLNPFNALEDSSWMVQNLIYDRLITYDEDLHAKPLIATSWEVADWPAADNLSTPNINEGANRLWRYHIVENATWQDGIPLTAEDVNYSINLNLDPSMWAFSPYISNRMADHAKAIDSKTVEVYLNFPNVHAETLVIPIVPKHIWSQYNVTQILQLSNDHPVGSGPFKFVEFVRDQDVILERNPNYFLGPVKYDRLVIKFYGSDQVMAADLKNGNVDVARFPPFTFNSLKGQPSVETAAVKRYYQSTVGFNCFNDSTSGGSKLLLDQNIRRAMELAINKSYIISTVWGGYGEVGYALPAPVIPYWHWEPTAPQDSLNFNVTRANTILDQAGYDKWVNGIRVVNRTDSWFGALDTPLSFKFNVRTGSPEDMAAAPYLKEMWKEIGVSVTIEPLDEAALETVIMSEAAHEVYMWYWSGDYDPTLILGVMTTDMIWGWNDPFWSNQTYDQLDLEQMTQTGAERQQTVFEMQKIFYEQAPLIVVTYPYALFAWSTLHFTGWGDPIAHPGRTMDQYTGANPLFMALQPKSSKAQGIPNTVMIGAGIAVVVVVVATAVALTMRKRRGMKPSKVDTEERKTGLD